MGTDLTKDWLNQYLSALSPSSDHYSELKMHFLGNEGFPLEQPLPVSTPLAVPPFLLPSFSVPPPPFEPTSPSFLSSDDSSDEEPGFPGFRSFDYDDEQHEPQGDNTRSSLSPPVPPLVSSYFMTDSSKIPVSLPLDAPEWTDILAANVPHDSGTTDDSVKGAEEDSRRARHMKEVERLREHNRQASTDGQSLAPLPNVAGLVIPIGYNDPLTSVSQIMVMSTAELNAWLVHYALPLPKSNGNQEDKQILLAEHLGIDTLPPTSGDSCLSNPQPERVEFQAKQNDTDLGT